MPLERAAWPSVREGSPVIKATFKGCR